VAVVTRALLTVVLALQLTVASGCGGDDGATNTDGQRTQPDPQTAAAAADAYGRAVDAALSTVIEQLNALPRDVDEFGEARYHNAVLPLESRARRAADALRALRPPRIVRDDHERLVSAAVGVADGLRGLGTASANSDPAWAQRSLVALEDDFQLITQTVEEIGTTLELDKLVDLANSAQQ
jgi:hypothetical protein